MLLLEARGSSPRMALQSKTSHATPDALGVGRGIAIIAMMYGHALAPWTLFAGDRFSDMAFVQWKFGASFLMMFFFFVSGLSWRETSSLRSTLRQSVGLILFAWSASALVEIAWLGISAAHLSAFWSEEPVSAVQTIKNIVRAALLGDYYAMPTMWFLTTLALVRLFAQLISRLGVWVVALTCIAMVALGLATVAFEWRNFYQVATIGIGLTGFMCGHYARPLYQRVEKNAGAAFAVLIVFGALLVATFGLNQGCPLDVTASCTSPRWNDNFAVAFGFGLLGNLPLFAVSAAAGCLFATSLSILLARQRGALGWWLAGVGRNTVALLVVNGAMLQWVHPLIVRFVTPWAPANAWYFYVGLLAFTIIVNLALAFVLQRPLKAWFAIVMKLATSIVDLPARLALKQANASNRTQ